MTQIEHNGRKYEYDADFDVFRPVPEPHEQTHMAQFGWIYFSIIALVIAYFTTQ
jgi:hypothetical protein